MDQKALIERPTMLITTNGGLAETTISPSCVAMHNKTATNVARRNLIAPTFDSDFFVHLFKSPLALPSSRMVKAHPSFLILTTHSTHLHGLRQVVDTTQSYMLN
jgi:hypothetical protein